VHELGAWPGLDTVAAVGATGQPPTVLVIDTAHHAHLLVPGRPAEDLPGELDIAGFATPDKLVLATPDGALYLHDVERHQRTPLVQPRAPLIGLAWGRGHHPWVAAAFADGTLWRKNLITGSEATTTRVPRLDPAHLTLRDGKLVVDADGTVVFVHDTAVHAWRADGTLEQLARLPKPIDDIAEAETRHVIAFAGDPAGPKVYALDRAAPDRFTEAIASLDGAAAAMSPDTGLLTVLDHGTLRVVDPLARQQWTLAPAINVAFAAPTISSDGRRVLAMTTRSPTATRSLLVWSLDLPSTPDDTARWLETLTNAAEDNTPGTLVWR
jgi:hypothetical protein